MSYPTLLRSSTTVRLWCNSRLSANQLLNRLFTRTGSRSCINQWIRRELHTNNTSAQKNRLVFDSRIDLSKDVVLFKYENPRYFKMLNFFAISQFFFWFYLSHFSFTTLRNVPALPNNEENKDVPWWRKINFGQYRNGISVGCFMIGWGILAFSGMYTLRSLRYLILKKDGNHLTFVTYSPARRFRSFTVPLEKVSAKQSRQSAGVLLPLKVRGHFMNYLLDMRGEFTNARLFDYSAGLKRSWAKS
ncbi:transmembrane protein 223-like isoform X1 [Oratosquilla oratoria]|uniref:transmembrane protein 223-like isoform X1 n=1 Tax=Oratosquilla oratoria TaxID=337810 RepID=UPI003F76DE48